MLRLQLSQLSAVKFMEGCEVLIYRRANGEWDALLGPCKTALDILTNQSSLWCSDGSLEAPSDAAMSRDMQDRLLQLLRSAG